MFQMYAMGLRTYAECTYAALVMQASMLEAAGTLFCSGNPVTEKNQPRMREVQRVISPDGRHEVVYLERRA